jgi:hypothetical protein
VTRRLKRGQQKDGKEQGRPRKAEEGGRLHHADGGRGAVEEEGKRERAQTTEVVDGEGDEGDAVEIDGLHGGLGRFIVPGVAHEFSENAPSGEPLRYPAQNSSA